MNLKELIKFGMEESQEPVIKNPILRQALEPRTMDLAEGGRIGFMSGKSAALDLDMDKPIGELTKAEKLKASQYLRKINKEFIINEGIPTFKTGPLDPGAPLEYRTTSTPLTDLLEVIYGTGPEGRYNQFVDEVKKFYSYPRSGGPKDQFSYARKAGMEIKDIKARYFPDFSDKYVEKIITKTAKKEGINTVRPSVEDYVKTLKKDLRKPVSEAAKDIARQRASLDPTGVWKGFPKDVKKGKMHHMFGKDTGETLSRLMVDPADETAWGSLEDALKNLDIEKRGLDLTKDADRRRLAVIQDTEKRILKGKDVTGRTLKARKTGKTFPISKIRTEKFKLERPGRKGKLGYEKFSIDDAGKVVKSRKGVDLSQTVAAQHWDDVKSLANVDFKTLKKGSPEWTKIRKVMENAYGDIGKTINNLNPREIGTICSAIRGLPGFSSGGSAKCITKINKAFLERPDDLMKALTKISKPSGKLKGVVNMAKTLGKGTGWFLLGEAALAQKPIRAALGKAFNLGFGPMGAAGLTYAFKPEGGYDLRSAGDRIGFEAEAALAPTLVKSAQSVTEKIKNPLLRKGLEYASGIRLPGVNPANMLRAARVASPVGLLSLAGEGIYHAGKKEMERRAKLSPEELADFHLKRQSRGWSGMDNEGIASLKKKW